MFSTLVEQYYSIDLILGHSNARLSWKRRRNFRILLINCKRRQTYFRITILKLERIVSRFFISTIHRLIRLSSLNLTIYETHTYLPTPVKRSSNLKSGRNLNVLKSQHTPHRPISKSGKMSYKNYKVSILNVGSSNCKIPYELCQKCYLTSRTSSARRKQTVASSKLSAPGIRGRDKHASCPADVHEANAARSKA